MHRGIYHTSQYTRSHHKNCPSARKPTINVAMLTIYQNPIDACASQRAGDIGAGESLPEAE